MREERAENSEGQSPSAAKLFSFSESRYDSVQRKTKA